MIVECPKCLAIVDTKEHGYIIRNGNEDEDSYKTTLLSCLKCQSAIVVGEELVQVSADSLEWRVVGRLWPDPERYISWDAPNIVCESFIEAQKCFKVGAFSACAVMCGRAIEGICRSFITGDDSSKRLYVAVGLKELLEIGVIDEKLYAWGIAINNHRNIGAHASIERITKEDAKDLLDFTYAMSDYIYVLNIRYERFMARQRKE